MRSRTSPSDRIETSLFKPRIRARRRGALALVLSAALLAGVNSAVAASSFILKWGTPGSADGQLTSPAGIAVDNSGNVYVAEGSGNRISKFDADGNFLLKFGVGGDVNGGFVTPSGVAVDSAGNIYTSDSFTNRIQKFSPAGAFLLTWGGGASSITTGVAVDSADNVYVTDTFSHQVRKFTSAGVPITSWGGIGSGNGQFNGPQGLSIDAADNVYVADTGNDRIQKFTSAGAFLTKWGTSGAGNGQFAGPVGVGADGAGSVYVADTGNSRVQKFSSAGAFIEAVGANGNGDGQFSGPQDVAANVAGTFFYVADTGNDRVQKFGTAVVTPPVADAGADQTVECAGALTPVTLNGAASTPGSNPITAYTWTEGASTLGNGVMLNVSLPAGAHTITLTVTDGTNSDTDDVIINVGDTLAPSIILNGANPMTVECHTGFSDPGATASDSCAGDLTGAITVGGSVNPNVVGSYSLTYTVSDGNGHTAMASRTVNVVDTTPPTITPGTQPIALWPPNHKHRTITAAQLVAGASDACDSGVGLASVVIKQVSSDEGAAADGDIVIAPDCKAVQLRSERDGNGNGRVYTITLRVSDTSGNTQTVVRLVTVPHDQGGAAAVDSGPAYTVAGGCP